MSAFSYVLFYSVVLASRNGAKTSLLGVAPPRSADVAEHVCMRPVLSAPVARAMAREYVRQVESQLGMGTPRQPMVWLPSLVGTRRLERVVYRLAAEPAWSLRPAVAVPRPHANLAPNRARPVIRHFPSEMEKPPFREACVHCNASRWNLCSDVVRHGHTWSTFKCTRARNTCGISAQKKRLGNHSPASALPKPTASMYRNARERMRWTVLLLYLVRLAVSVSESRWM